MSESFALANDFIPDGTTNIPIDELDTIYDYIQVACSMKMDIPLTTSSSGIIKDQGYMSADVQVGASDFLASYALNVMFRAGGAKSGDHDSGIFTTSFYLSDFNNANDGAGGSGEYPYYQASFIVDTIKRERWDELGFYATTRWNGWSYTGRMGALIKFNDVYVDYYAEAEKLHKLSFYADVDGREYIDTQQGLIIEPYSPSVIANILNLIGLTFADYDLPDTNLYDWRNDFTVSETITAKKLIEEIASTSPYIPRFGNDGKFKFDVIKDRYDEDDIENAVKIQESDCIKWSYSKTKIEDVYSRIKLHYKKNYARDEYDGYFEMDVVEDLDQFEIDDTYFEYYGIKLDHLDSTLEIESDYIRDDDTAKKYVKWLLYWHCNSHLKIKVKLPLKYLNVEIGNIIAFDKVLGEIEPYGIDYKQNATFKLTVDDVEVEYLGEFVNFSQAYPLFLCTSTNKTLEYIEMECIQLHKLSDDE